MRERATPDSIDLVLAAVRRAWIASPEQRLGQLLLNAMRAPNGAIDPHRLWNADEATLIDALPPIRWSDE